MFVQVATTSPAAGMAIRALTSTKAFEHNAALQNWLDLACDPAAQAGNRCFFPDNMDKRRFCLLSRANAVLPSTLNEALSEVKASHNWVLIPSIVYKRPTEVPRRGKVVVVVSSTLSFDEVVQQVHRLGVVGENPSVTRPLRLPDIISNLVIVIFREIKGWTESLNRVMRWRFSEARRGEAMRVRRSLVAARRIVGRKSGSRQYGLVIAGTGRGHY